MSRVFPASCPPPARLTSLTATWTTHTSCLACCLPPAPMSANSTSASTISLMLACGHFFSHPPSLFNFWTGLEISWKPGVYQGNPCRFNEKIHIISIIRLSNLATLNVLLLLECDLSSKPDLNTLLKISFQRVACPRLYH